MLDLVKSYTAQESEAQGQFRAMYKLSGMYGMSSLSSVSYWQESNKPLGLCHFHVKEVQDHPRWLACAPGDLKQETQALLPTHNHVQRQERIIIPQAASFQPQDRNKVQRRTRIPRLTLAHPTPMQTVLRLSRQLLSRGPRRASSSTQIGANLTPMKTTRDPAQASTCSSHEGTLDHFEQISLTKCSIQRQAIISGQSTTRPLIIHRKLSKNRGKTEQAGFAPT
ncbi:hypothetical protein PIIN_10148 [Serendipita indica DSM 11827]|uniref:Uncharacterized protein n=1 Tax=Serendipita indica (strain DSM 11827) TaxID=1109443 RepID=G4TXV5_SERID|nr:hypothetical protein PIIN_10148 [Serendipita indica DSM 11827]